MSYLDRLQAISANPAGAEPLKGAKGSFDPFEGLPTGRFHGLPADCAEGLARLANMPSPRIPQPAMWTPIVADALKLAADGWAERALALGWLPLELFGCSGRRGGDARQEGLATWLAGRRVLLLDALSCIAADGGGGRSIFYGRSVAPGGVFLWELGKAKVSHDEG